MSRVERCRGLKGVNAWLGSTVGQLLRMPVIRVTVIRVRVVRVTVLWLADTALRWRHDCV